MNELSFESVIARVLVESGARPTDYEWNADVVTLKLPRGDVRMRIGKTDYQDLEGTQKRLQGKARKKRVLC